MTNTDTAFSNYDKIRKLINSARFNEAFLLLKNKMSKYPTLKQELEKIKSEESSYRFFLDYISDGNIDPSKEEMIEKVRESLHNANLNLYREEKLTDSPDIYSSTRRLQALRKISFSGHLDNFLSSLKEDTNEESGATTISADQARMIEEVFNYVWTLGSPSKEDYENISEALSNRDVPDYLKVLIVSAITLGNLEYFDPSTFELLIQQYENADSENIKARAAAGILLISLLNSNRIAGNIKLRSRLLLSADEDRSNLFNKILLNIIKTFDTRRIDNKMRNEVIPGLMKINPEIIEKMRNMASDSENFLSDENPHWEELMENSDIGEKMEEINNMQMEGADVMVTAFSNLKSFPFFNQVFNWFMPVVPGHYEIDKIGMSLTEEQIQKFTYVMCESDIHSFLLSLASMPDTQREMVVSNMEKQMKEAKEALSDSVGEKPNEILERKIRFSLQDLYRFFNFYRKKNDFTNPFSQAFIGPNIEPLINLFGLTEDYIKLTGEFYFKNKYFEESASIFELIDKLSPGDFSLWEKIGFSYHRIGNFNKATEWYKKAELVSPGNQWLGKQLAMSLKNSGHPEEALDYYQKSLDKDSENYHLLISTSQCLIDLGRYPEALQHLYHAQYLKPDKTGVKRAVAWAELMNRDYEKAIAMYKKLLESPEADKNDFLNAAHCHLASGNFREALNLYRLFIEKTPERNITNLVIAFKDDAKVLKQLGIPTSDLRLIVDKIRYEKEGA